MQCQIGFDLKLYPSFLIVLPVQILHKGQLSPAKTAWNYFVAILGVTCTVFGTVASLKSLAAKAASVSVGA